MFKQLFLVGACASAATAEDKYRDPSVRTDSGSIVFSVDVSTHTLPIRYHPQLFSSSEPGRRNEASSRVRKLEIELTALVYFRTDTLSTRHVARDLWTYRKLQISIEKIYLPIIYSMTDMFCLKRATMPRSASMKP